jgi:hypothetical protein
MMTIICDSQHARWQLDIQTAQRQIATCRLVYGASLTMAAIIAYIVELTHTLCQKNSQGNDIFPRLSEPLGEVREQLLVSL